MMGPKVTTADPMMLHWREPSSLKGSHFFLPSLFVRGLFPKICPFKILIDPSFLLAYKAPISAFSSLANKFLGEMQYLLKLINLYRVNLQINPNVTSIKLCELAVCTTAALELGRKASGNPTKLTDGTHCVSLPSS